MATRGMGLIMTEAQAVVPEGRITPSDAGATFVRMRRSSHP